MLVRWLLRPTSLAMLAGGGLCAVAAGQIEIWLRGIWSFDVTALAACAGAVLAGVAISRTRTSPVVYGSARFPGGSTKRFYRALIRKADQRFDRHLARLVDEGES